MMTSMALEFDLKAKVGPRMYQRFVLYQRLEEVTQAELIRRALDHYFNHLDERQLRLVSLMADHAERAE